MLIKDFVRKLLIFAGLDLSLNLKYDRLTRKILKNSLRPDSNCIDIGCHKGEMLDLILKLSPKGSHFAFEPLPHLYKELKNKFSGRCQILPYALADEAGKTSFQYVKNAPAYSGLKKRSYAVKKPDIEEIEVDIIRLDDVIPENAGIDFIKIDVEGGEFGVLKGGLKTIKESKPIIIFEFGKGSSEYYNTSPEDIYKFFIEECGFRLNTLQGSLKNKPPLNLYEFAKAYDTNSDYYFIASPY